ncbi:MAG TPA: S8 family serine peptidase [Baekduia sp.]|uniref:S8 family serine peptidase n=1 Tax=Baekduia sp. TaxID=2600305 RepID=UPI002D76DA4D|nr:S8 family serine peptidase [Baekduia sp.]HET6506782.1 S8 family serine peptidase [Baekduia sp.]
MSRTTTGPLVLGALLLALAVPAGAAASAYESDPTGYARGLVVPAGLAPPAAFAPIGIVDDVVDGLDVPDVAQVKVLKRSPGKRLNTGGGAEVAHGTEVASVAAGRADGQGVLGIAPGAPLLSWGYKTLSCAEVSEGILALAAAGAKVINLSFETEDACDAMRLAVAAAYGEGALVVASAGNEREHGDPTEYPASYPHVLTVGALDLGAKPASFSSSGRGLDLVAPGEAIPVALPAALDRDGTADGLTRVDGTSFAAPMVSGVASWLIAARPGLSPSQYADLLRASARDVGAPGWDSVSGFGAVDLAAALAAPVPPADHGEPDDDAAQVDGTDFDRPDPYLTGTVKATAAPVEDPADWYRVRVKARSTKTIKLTTATAARALSLVGYRGTTRVASGAKTIKLRNATRKSQTFYAVVRASGHRVATALAYTLKAG